MLSAIVASFGFLYEAFNLGPSLISKVLQSGGAGVWLTGNIVSLAGSDNCPKVVPRICNLLFLLFFYFRPWGPHKIEPIESDELDEEYFSFFVPTH